MENTKMIYPVVQYQTSDYHNGDGVRLSFDTETGFIHVSVVYDCDNCGFDGPTLDIRELIHIALTYNPDLLR